MSIDGADYAKGYAAGRKCLKQARADRAAELIELRRERVFMKSLELTLKHCSGWRIEGKTINNAQGYCRLAKIFADHAITAMR